MSKETVTPKEVWEIFEKTAVESGSRHAFYSGMVFGLAHAISWLERENVQMAYGMMQTLLYEIDEGFFKKEQG